MSKRFVFLPEALADIQEITRYIAADNPGAARRLKESIQAACERLCDYPHMGQLRADLTTAPVHFWPVHTNYMIVYNLTRSPLEIVRVLHNARHLPSVLQ